MQIAHFHIPLKKKLVALKNVSYIDAEYIKSISNMW